MRNQLNELCENYSIEYIANLVCPNGVTSSSNDEISIPFKRKRTISQRFQDSIVTERLPCYHEEIDNVKKLRALVIEVVSNLNIEFITGSTNSTPSFGYHLNP